MALTASQIVNQACSISKCPGYLTQGGQNLNLVLQDLVMHRNLKATLVKSTITVPANSNGPFNLETDYLRTYDMWFLVNGEPYFLNPGSLEEMDMESQAPGLASYPYEWASDPATTPWSLYIYPQSNNLISLIHRYYSRNCRT